MDFDYNTSRKQLVLPEYGRNIQKMVDHVKTIEDDTERNRLAHAIVGIMGNLNPHLRDINDFKHKLWDHLAIIANFELDIEFPYEIPKAEMFRQKPRIVPYGTHEITYRHYGKAIESIIETVCEMEDGEDKMRMTNVVANHMKKSYLMWNRDTVSDDVILKDLAKLSKNRLDLSQVKLLEVREVQQQNRPRRPQRNKNQRKNK